MGHGDEIMASGMARGAAARGKRIAFGDGTQIRWHPHAHEIFRNNPNVAPPGSENDPNLEWIAHYAGKRVYNYRRGFQWRWVKGFNDRPGELFFDHDELAFAQQFEPGFVLVEPNVPAFKSVAPNKQWPVSRYQEVTRRLIDAGHRVLQLVYGRPYGPGYALRGAVQVESPSFRHGLAILARAALYVGPEGGLHHGAAAVGTSAVVIFGGFISPDITGYSAHRNIFVGNGADGRACGNVTPCGHCKAAMASISVEKVEKFALDELRKLNRIGPIETETAGAN